MTAHTCLNAYIDELSVETERQRTYKGDKSSHATQINKFKFAKLPLGLICKSHVHEFRNMRIKECSTNTVRNNLNTISKVFSHATSE